MNQWKRHNLSWFIERIGEEVRKEFTGMTPTRIKEEPKPLVIRIADEKHAKGIHQYHKDYKVNIEEVNQQIKNTHNGAKAQTI